MSTTEALVETKQPQQTEPPVEEKIRARAYELFESRNHEDGHEWDDWFQAEAEITEKSGH